MTPIQAAKKRKYYDTPRPSTIKSKPIKEYSLGPMPTIQSAASSSSSHAYQLNEKIDDNEVWTKFVLTEFKRFKNLDNLEDTKWKMLNILKENLIKDRIENKYSSTMAATSSAGSSSAIRRRNINSDDHFDKYDHDYY